MVEVSQKLHFSEGSQTEHGVVERSNLLDSDLLAGRLVDGRAVKLHVSVARSKEDSYVYLPDDTVGTFTDNILNVILLADVE